MKSSQALALDTHAHKCYKDSLNRPQSHFDILHSEQVGTVPVWKNKDSWHKIEPTTEVDIDTFINSLILEYDTYLSVNEFYGWRKTNLLK